MKHLIEGFNSFTNVVASELKLEEGVEKVSKSLEEGVGQVSKTLASNWKDLIHIIAPLPPQEEKEEEKESHQSIQAGEKGNSEKGVSPVEEKQEEKSFEDYLEENGGKQTVEFFKEKEADNMQKIREIMRNCSTSEKVKLNEEVKSLRELFNGEEGEGESDCQEMWLERSGFEQEKFECLFMESLKEIEAQQTAEQVVQKIYKHSASFLSFALQSCKKIADFLNSLPKEEEREARKTLEEFSMFVSQIVELFASRMEEICLTSFKNHPSFQQESERVQQLFSSVQQISENANGLLFETKKQFLFSSFQLKLFEWRTISSK